MTRNSLARSAVLLMILLAGSMLASGVASAQAAGPTKIELALPVSAAVGDEIELKATITVDGAPVAGVEVEFLRFTEFMNSGNDLLIGTGITDGQGLASVTYMPRSEGEILITAEVVGGEGVRAAFTDSTIEIRTGPGLYQVEAGISVPGINVAWLAIVLAIIWSLFMYVMFLVWRIASEGSLETSLEGEGND